MTWLDRLRDVRRKLSPAGWIVTFIAAAVVLALAVWLITWPGRQAQKTADAQAGQAFGEARTGAAVVAIGTVTNNASKAGEIDARVKGSEDAIRNAPADQRDDVTLRELCHSPSAVNSPECRLFKPGAGGVGKRN